VHIVQHLHDGCYNLIAIMPMMCINPQIAT
jgi:hypothetical protein